MKQVSILDLSLLSASPEQGMFRFGRDDEDHYALSPYKTTPRSMGI